MKIRAVVACGNAEVFPESKFISTVLVSENTADIVTDYRDDEGINIAHLSAHFGDLTALYWAWKNMDFDYICFQFDNRYFCMGQTNIMFHAEPLLTKYSLQSIVCWNDQMLTAWAKDCRWVAPVPIDVSYLGSTTVREYYLRLPNRRHEDLEMILRLIRERNPVQGLSADSYLDTNQFFPGQLLAMEYDDFNAYCTWLFDLLFEFEKHRNISHCSEAELIAPQYLAELLYGVYITIMKEKPGREDYPSLCPSVYFKEIKPLRYYKPAFEEKNVAIALVSSNYYAPYCATVVRSIIDHASDGNNYDILILTKDINAVNQQMIGEVARGHSNFSVRFVDVLGFIPPRDFRTAEHFTIESYFRSMIPYVLPHHDKVIYLDCDLVVLHDLAELYAVEIGDYLLAAVEDPLYAGLICRDDTFWGNYNVDILHISKDSRYFNAGVIVMNTLLFRKMFSMEYLLQLGVEGNFIFCDQDVLNVICEGKTRYLDFCWNVLADTTGNQINVVSSAGPQVLESYMAARKTPFIIHFADKIKPWQKESGDFADVFWKIARTTPLYEIILHRMSYDIIQRRAAEHGLAGFPKESNI